MAAKLAGEFQYNIPRRWSIAHLCQAVLNKEEYVTEDEIKEAYEENACYGQEINEKEDKD